MILTPLDANEQPTNIISLSEARTRFAPGRCQHKRVQIDEALSEVECRDCGAKLNPVHVLVRMAREESVWAMRLAELTKLREQLDKKQRTKCLHCGQMTPVRIPR